MTKTIRDALIETIVAMGVQPAVAAGEMLPLAVGILATVLGTALGLVTGYFRGAVDDVLSRIIEAFLALPVIIMGLLVVVALGPSRITLILTIGVLFAPIISRTVRAGNAGFAIRKKLTDPTWPIGAKSRTGLTGDGW